MSKIFGGSLSILQKLEKFKKKYFFINHNVFSEPGLERIS